MPSISRATVGILAFALEASSVGAQARTISPQAAPPTTTTDAAQKTYPHTPEGVQAQVAEVCDAWRSRDVDRLAASLDIFELPNRDELVRRAIGAEKAAEVASSYEPYFSGFKTMLTSECALSRGYKRPEIEASRAIPEHAIPIVPRRVTAALEVMRELDYFEFSFKVPSGLCCEGLVRVYGKWMTTFFYDGGAFRYLGTGGYPFWEREKKAAEAAALKSLLPQPTHQVQPDYGEWMRKSGVAGKVHLKVKIAGDGAVEKVEAIDGEKKLVEVAEKAVKKWRYAPSATMEQLEQEAGYYWPGQVITVEVAFPPARGTAH